MPPFSIRQDLGILRLPEDSPWRALARRIGFAVGLIVLVSIFLWADREGLRDNSRPEESLRFVDVFYFTVVSLTTVGYGDIVPVTGFARFVNAVFLTPIRLVIWAIFLGTAYEIVLIRTRESFKMAQLRSRLEDHTLICGFGVKGRAILSELVAHAHPLDKILVIDPDDKQVSEATALGVAALRGDASVESVLSAAAVERAGHVLVAPHSDDQCVLICLTVRELNAHVRLVASAREEENVKLLYRAGADVVVAPSVSGGRLMGAAVRQSAVTTLLQDVTRFGSGLEAAELCVGADEAGRRADETPALKEKVVLGICRGKTWLPMASLRETVLLADDIVVYMQESNGKQSPEKESDSPAENASDGPGSREADTPASDLPNSTRF